MTWTCHHCKIASYWSYKETSLQLKSNQRFSPVWAVSTQWKQLSSCISGMTLTAVALTAPRFSVLSLGISKCRQFSCWKCFFEEKSTQPRNIDHLSLGNFLLAAHFAISEWSHSFLGGIFWTAAAMLMWFLIKVCLRYQACPCLPSKAGSWMNYSKPIVPLPFIVLAFLKSRIVTNNFRPTISTRFWGWRFKIITK